LGLVAANRANGAFFGVILALGSVVSSAPGRAIDINSTDWIYLAPGTKLAVSYTQYGTRSEYVSKSGDKISDGTNLESLVEVLRYVHVTEVAGFTTALEVIQPLGTLYNGELGGADLGSTSGWGDTTLTALLYLYHDKDTSIGIAPFLVVPLGQYSETDALNLGENRWKLDLQAGWYQALGKDFSFQLAGAVIWYGDNKDAGGGSATLSQDNTYYFQGWLSYNFAPSWSASVGYAKYWGGDEFLSGVETGNATDKQQIRAELSKFVTPTFQVLGDVSRDVETSGAFKEDFRGTLRLLKVF
jgi:hypothetical protein